ncbi:uncharacterized protein LOC121410088 isoform X2 [Lytechinus variegatus]|uniref:uncharacterized protein LOC121410088 isoform X2 n=1 Tax=Lytechinus variegatus TaxID=7654 RepID=UPI001BB1EB09|nr:uncharacterized protein LOC121410088 isoform X2 [Lytechinus variegatus]
MPNNLNKSELFSSFPGQSFSSSATNSQVMGSQMENSQSSSFDLFSQMMSQQQGYSQQNESTSSNFYMKYMSKPPLFQKDGASKKTTCTLPRRKSFQGMQEFYREKAKDRDDRDLINTFIAIVKDCADEVKHAASSIKKDIDSNITETTSRTAEVMNKIANELALHHKQLLNSLKTREDHEAKVKDLMETIASKDAKIQLLESQLETAKSDRNEHLLKAMLDMYKEQQSVTKQHLDKVHEEQQNIKNQQSMLLKETEKSHATLNRMTSAAHARGDESKRMFQIEREINHSTSSSVPPISVGTTFNKCRYLPGIAESDGIERSKITPLQTNTDSCQVTSQLHVNQMSVPNPTQGQLQSLYPSSSQCGVSDDVVPRAERKRMPLNTSSQLFQNPPVSYQNYHQDLSNGMYAIEPVVRPESLYQPQGSAHPALPQYRKQAGSTRNHLQDNQNLSTSTNYPTGKKTSCYNHFNNKFSSPNYTSSNQLWSKKNLKPSPVATIAPQAHCIKTYDDGSQDTQVISTRKQSSQKRHGKGAAEWHQPQRKSARLSARNSPENANGFCSLKEERGEEDRPSRRKSKPRKKGRSHYVAQSEKENESRLDESQSVDEMIPTYMEQKFPSAKRGAFQNHISMKKLPTQIKQDKTCSTIPSTSTRSISDIRTIENNSSDEDDEYTFHDDHQNPPATTFKAVHTVKRSTSCGDKVKHEQQEVFTKRSVITYSTPKGMKEKCTSAQGSTCNMGQMNNSTLGRQNIKDKCWQGRGVSAQCNNPDADILDTIKTYTQSEEEESSQEIQFSLILPDHLELQQNNNLVPADWSSVMSPSVNSCHSEQVVPDKLLTKRPSKNLTSTRKRRMIYGSKDDLRKSMAQLITPI